MLNFKNINLFFCFLFVGIYAYDLFYGIRDLWLVVAIAVWFLLTFMGSFNIGWNYFTKAFNRKRSSKEKKIALTFDDGPHPEHTPLVLDVLKKHKTKATFFLIGKHIEAHPDIVKRIHREGHDIGNHSYSHSNTIAFSIQKKWRQELSKTERLIEMNAGKSKKLFRPPYGVTTPSLARAIEQSKHDVIGWNIRPFDTVVKNTSLVIKTILTKLKSGSIVLLHDTHTKAPEILERLLSKLKEKGYQAVSITELQNES